MHRWNQSELITGEAGITKGVIRQNKSLKPEINLENTRSLTNSAHKPLTTSRFVAAAGCFER